MDSNTHMHKHQKHNLLASRLKNALLEINTQAAKRTYLPYSNQLNIYFFDI